MTRDEIEFAEFVKTAIESAVGKGKFLTSAEIDATPGMADFIRQYDWVVALWPDAANESGMGALLVRESGMEAAYARCNSIPCDNKATALKLHALCRQASEPPPSYSIN